MDVAAGDYHKYDMYWVAEIHRSCTRRPSSHLESKKKNEKATVIDDA